MAGKRPLPASSASPVDAVALASETLQGICQDENAPAAARAQAARTLLELAGALKTGLPNEQKPGAEMTASEIDARLAALNAPGASAPGVERPA